MTPEQLEEMKAKIEKLRGELLFDEELVGMSAEAEQLFLLALSALEQAGRYMTLALYKQRQALPPSIGWGSPRKG